MIKIKKKVGNTKAAVQDQLRRKFHRWTANRNSYDTLNKQAVDEVLARINFPYIDENNVVYYGNDISSTIRLLSDNYWKNHSGMKAEDFAKLGCQVITARCVFNNKIAPRATKIIVLRAA